MKFKIGSLIILIGMFQLLSFTIISYYYGKLGIERIISIFAVSLVYFCLGFLMNYINKDKFKENKK